MIRRALLLAVLALAVAAPAASAHATLEGSTPQRGADVAHAPRAVTFRFDESVEAAFGAVRVYDARGKRVDDDRVTHPGGQGKLVRVGLRPGLPRGSYTATYRVISADSHPVSGGLVFTVGHGGPTSAATVADLLGKGGAGPVTETAFGVARGLAYLATAVLLGGLAFLWLVWGPGLAAAAGGDERWRTAAEAFARRARIVLLGAALLGVVATAAGLVLQAATAGGTSGWSALASAPLREVLHTRFGTLWTIRLAAFALMGVMLLLPLGRRATATLRPAAVGADGLAPTADPAPALLAPAAVLAAALAITPGLAGHAGVQHPVWLLLPLDVLHVLAMSAWVGGLLALLLLVPVATRRLEPPERSRLLAGLLVRFSPVALGAVVVLLVTGVAQAIVHIRHLDALTGTAFGRAVLIKVVLLLALIALGAVNRQRVIPRLRALADGHEPPGDAGRLLRTTLRAEVALLVVVLGVTSALVSYPPPIALAAGPVSKSVTLGSARLDLTLDPARIGANELHLYLFDRRTGAPFTRTKELTVDATLPDKHVGPLKVDVRRAGPGHYVADGLTLTPGGTWTLRFTDRVSAFDESTGATTVDVR